MKLTKIFSTLLFLGLIPFFGNSQVTTSSITGSVQSSTGENLEGATVTAVHTPSGTQYQTLAKTGGTFILPNLRIGGPYTVTVNYVGFKVQTFEGINLVLGEPYNLKVVMGEDIQEIEAVVVSGRRSGAVAKTGAATNIGQQQ